MNGKKRGRCDNHKQAGGCPLHNLQCGWPECDEYPDKSSEFATVAASKACPACGSFGPCIDPDSCGATEIIAGGAAAHDNNQQAAREWRLFDSQWVNIVNHAGCYQGMSKDDAVAMAVKLTEQAMTSNFISAANAGIDRASLERHATCAGAVPPNCRVVLLSTLHRLLENSAPPRPTQERSE